MPYRRLVLPALFLTGAAVLAGPGPARGQWGPHHRPPPFTPTGSEPVTTEQVKEFLKRVSGGRPPADLNPYAELLDRIQKQNPKLVEEVREKLRTDPAFRDWATKEAERFKRDGKAIPDAAELRKHLTNDGPPRPEPAGLSPPDIRPPGPQPTPPPSPDLPTVGGPGNDRVDSTQRLPPDRGNTLERLVKNLDPYADPYADRGKTPEQLLREKRLRAAAALWERNVGPLEETPAVKRALMDLVSGTDDLSDGDGNNIWDAIGKEGGEAGSFADWMERAAQGESWKMPNLDLGLGSTRLGQWWSGTMNVGGGGAGSSTGGRWSGGDRSYRWGSSSGPGSFSLGGLEGSWLPVVLLAAILIGGLVWWRFWYLRDPTRGPGDLAEHLGPWPIDPRHIASREDLVRAFEYLSVLTCGRVARTWTHGTIARALADLAATHAATALLLARLYELARYAPLDEPLTPAELAEARRLVCQLAGVRVA